MLSGDNEPTFCIKIVKLNYQKLARRLSESPTFCFLGYLKKTNLFWSTLFAEKWNYSGTHSFYRCKRVWAQIWPRRKITKNAQKRLRVDPGHPEACQTPPGTQNGAKMNPKWSQHGQKMEPKWTNKCLRSHLGRTKTTHPGNLGNNKKISFFYF